jgi:PAS domain S-box-containing protein
MSNKLPNDNQPAESSLANLNEIDTRYRLLMDLSADGIVIVQDGVIKDFNRSMAKLCGCHPESMRDNALAEYFPTDEISGVKALIDMSDQGSNGPRFRAASLAGKNGQRLDVEISAVGCNFQQKPASLLIITDISDRLTARESIEKAGKLDAIAPLSGGIAHDYNRL